MGLCLLVKVVAMPIKAPGQLRVANKPTRISYLLETQSQSRKRWIGAPKALRATKIRQARINTHAGSGTNDQSISPRNDFSSPLNFAHMIHHRQQRREDS